MKIKTKRLAVYALLVSLALIFSYLESLISLPLLPGVKLGLANGIVLLLVWLSDIKGAALVNFVRIAVSSLLFGNLTVFYFSVLGAAFSLFIMCLAKRLKASILFTSILGAVAHNVGQLIAAITVFMGFGPMYYLPLLCLSGILCGTLIGIVCFYLLKNKVVVNLLKNF